MDDHALERYSRQVLVPGVDLGGQARLADASVLIVGCGGLGALAAQYLAGAGVGHLTLVDPDRVELSNLPRQIAYTENDLGAYKAEALARRLYAMNASLQIDSHSIAFDASSGPGLLHGVDAVLDGTDNHEARLAIDAMTAPRGLPWFMGAAVQMAGQNIAFSSSRSEGCYHCLAPESSAEQAGGCSQLGILGPVVGSVALRQVLDLFGALVGVPAVPWGRLRQYDFRTDAVVSVALQKRPGCGVCGLGDSPPNAV